MATHDRYEQDILKALKGIDNSLKALKGIDNSLKRIADALVPGNEKKTINKPKIYYETYCPTCERRFTFDGFYPIEDPKTHRMNVSCPYCNHLFTLPIGWEGYKTNEQDN